MLDASTPKKRDARHLSGAADSTKKGRSQQMQATSLLSAGRWVTVIPDDGRRKVDKLKSSAPCLITSISKDLITATVLYPNMVSLFLQQSDGTTVRFRTERQSLPRLRPCPEQDVAALDRALVMAMCKVMSESKDNVMSAACGSSCSAPNQQEEADAMGKEQCGAFTLCVSKAFQAAARDVLDKVKLCSALADAGFTSSEIKSGLKMLEDLNKIMVADDAVFLV